MSYLILLLHTVVLGTGNAFDGKSGEINCYFYSAVNIK